MAQNRSRCTVADDRGKSKRRASWCGACRRPRQCSAAETTLEDSAAPRPNRNSARPVCIIRACPRTTRGIPNLIAIRRRRREKKQRSRSRGLCYLSARTSFPVSTGSRIDWKYVKRVSRKHSGRGNLLLCLLLFLTKNCFFNEKCDKRIVSMIYLKGENHLRKDFYE